MNKTNLEIYFNNKALKGRKSIIPSTVIAVRYRSRYADRRSRRGSCNDYIGVFAGNIIDEIIYIMHRVTIPQRKVKPQNVV